MGRRAVVAIVIGVVVLAGAASCGNDGGEPSAGGGGPTTTQASGPPAPPQLPAEFTWTGRYVVPDLGVEVPFTWQARDGDMQMTAGDDTTPIHFSNIISDGTLYTVTYTWPEIPRLPCSRVGPFTLAELNAGLGEATFVGPETLDDAVPLAVNHFRAHVVWEPTPEEIPRPADVPVLRFPIMSGDIYVDRQDSTSFWKVLHFGIHNLYAKELDEWIVIDDHDADGGEITLPDECAAPADPTTTS